MIFNDAVKKLRDEHNFSDYRVDDLEQLLTTRCLYGFILQCALSSTNDLLAFYSTMDNGTISIDSMGVYLSDEEIEKCKSIVSVTNFLPVQVLGMGIKL